MTNILLISHLYPASASSGRHLRMHNYCKELARRHGCYLVYAGDRGSDDNPLSDLGVREYESLPEFPAHGGSKLRHLRTSNANFLKLSAPKYLAKARRSVQELCDQWRIDAIVCLTTKMAEIVIPIHLPKILDYCDSRTLTLKRMLANRSQSLTAKERANFHLQSMRQRGLERTFLREFDCTWTISEADRACFLDVSRVRPDKVVVIPNGVSPSALEAGVAREQRHRSVVFWGNLDFPPNWTAVEFFFRDVYLPYLEREGISWHIYGSGGSDLIRSMARHPGIHVHGFVEDLFEEVVAHGAMVNPMVEGSGLKNKVLEAFACKVPVVSSAMGIDAIDARPDVHYLRAETAAEFAQSVGRILIDSETAARLSREARCLVEEKYVWKAIGDQLASNIDRVIARTSQIGSNSITSDLETYSSNQ